MKTGDVVFVSGSTIVSRLIKYFDSGRFSHVALCVSSSHVFEAQYLTKTDIVPFHFTDYEIVKMNLTEKQKNDLICYIEKFRGRNYDYVRFLGHMLKLIFKLDLKGILNLKNNLICSEIDILLYLVGAIPQDEYLGDKSPNQLYHYLKSVKVKT
jgi:hypothetical protein